MRKDKFDSDFHEFLDSEDVAPPAELSQRVLSTIQKDLVFYPALVVAKLGLIHTFTTLSVLYVCPQFGVGWGNPSLSLLDFFMRFGHLACAALCGALLVGGTFFMTALLLKPQESFWLKRQMPWVPISLSVLTLVILVLMGATAHHTEFVLWCVFGVLAGWGTFEIGRKGRVYGVRFYLRFTT